MLVKVCKDFVLLLSDFFVKLLLLSDFSLNLFPSLEVLSFLVRKENQKNSKP